MAKQQAKQPSTLAEWQEAVDLAEFYLHLDSARKYGLIQGGAESIDVGRCEQLLAAGKRRGGGPTADCVERLSQVFMVKGAT